jgi:hypothetical protein
MSKGTLDTYIHIISGRDISQCRGQQDTKLLETTDTLKLMWIIKVEEFVNCDKRYISHFYRGVFCIALLSPGWLSNAFGHCLYVGSFAAREVRTKRNELDSQGKAVSWQTRKNFE